MLKHTSASFLFFFLFFFTSFLVSVLSQLWILRGHFLCCLSLMRLQGTPYCKKWNKESVKSIEITNILFWHELPEHAAQHHSCTLGKQCVSDVSLALLEVRTFSPPAWTSQKEWSSWAAWSPLTAQWLRPQLRLWWWSAYCPPPSLQFQKSTITNESHTVCLLNPVRVKAIMCFLHLKLLFSHEYIFKERELSCICQHVRTVSPKFHFTKHWSYMCIQRRINLKLWDNSPSSTTMRLMDALWFLPFSLGFFP